MKVSHRTTLCVLGILISLICSPAPHFAFGSSLGENLNHRFLETVPGRHYKYEREIIDPDNTLIYFAKFGGNEVNYGNSQVIQNIKVEVSFKDKDTFNVKISDSDNNSRWQIPEKAPFPHFTTQKSIPMEKSCCQVEILKEPCFNILITNRQTNAILFDTRNKDFFLSDLYIQLSTKLPNDNVYGFGERYYKFKLSPGTYTIWGRDDPKILEIGRGGGNTYSHHPVGLFKDEKDNFFLTLMRNSNAMDVIIDSEPALTYKMVGGIVDLVFFVGDKSPETVLKLYHNYLGNFTMMPFWSMGFHQSKWGYTSHSVMNDIVTKYNSNKIPLDVIWSDIDYMIDKEIFTVNTRNYPPDRMKDLTTVHKKKWVPIIDPGVRITNPQGPGTRVGLEKDVFLKNRNGGYLSGYVWPGRVYFPDLFHPNAAEWWSDMLEHLYQIIPFAGIWLDMNEVANFVDGEEHRYDWGSKYDNIPYTPGDHPLRHKTISLDAQHSGGYSEYDVHGLFSLMECDITHRFLQKKSKLPFILTRSTSMGAGKFAAHWTGDNGASWDFLKHSISGNFNFQIFGIPFVGADICGFMDDTNDELCARWTQLGALYPFARNHHEERTRNQEPWTFNVPNHGVSVLETTRIALRNRYAMLKWYYSLFIETGGAGSVFKPLLFEFPQEAELYNDNGFTDWEFMLGSGLLCTPKVESGEPFVNAYFPKTNWFEFFTGKLFIDQTATERVKRVETPFDATVPMFLRAGHIVHTQNVDNVLSTEDLDNNFEFLIALDKNDQGQFAKGSIMGIKSFDDESVYTRCMEQNCLYDVSVSSTTEEAALVILKISFKRQKDTKIPLDSFNLIGIKIYGMSFESLDEEEDNGIYIIYDLEKINGPESEKSGITTSVYGGIAPITFQNMLEIEDGDVLTLEFRL